LTLALLVRTILRARTSPVKEPQTRTVSALTLLLITGSAPRVRVRQVMSPSTRPSILRSPVQTRLPTMVRSAPMTDWWELTGALAGLDGAVSACGAGLLVLSFSDLNMMLR
jgi:hypothetical protein